MPTPITPNEKAAALDGHGDLNLVLRTATAQSPRKDRTDVHISDIEIRIIKTPVRTLGGLLTKARVAWHITALDHELDELQPVHVEVVELRGSGRGLA